MINYKSLDETTPSGFQIVRILDGDFLYVDFVFGKVDISEEDGFAKVSFEYEIINDPRESVNSESEPKFKVHIGEVLDDLIRKMVEGNSVIYTGGTD